MNRSATAKNKRGSAAKPPRSLRFNETIRVKPYWKNMSGTHKHVQPPRKSRRFWNVALPPKVVGSERYGQIAYWIAKAHEYGGTLENMMSFVETHNEIPEGMKDSIMNRLAQRYNVLEKPTMEKLNEKAARERAAATPNEGTANAPEYGQSFLAPLRPANNTNLGALAARHGERKAQVALENAAQQMIQQTLTDAIQAGFPATYKYMKHPLLGIGYFTDKMQFKPVSLFEIGLAPGAPGLPPVPVMRIIPNPPSLAPNKAAGFKHMLHSHEGYILAGPDGNYSLVELLPRALPPGVAPIIVPINMAALPPVAAAPPAAPPAAQPAPPALPAAAGTGLLLPALEPAVNTFGNDPFANFPSSTMPATNAQFNNL